MIFGGCCKRREVSDYEKFRLSGFQPSQICISAHEAGLGSQQAQGSLHRQSFSRRSSASQIFFMLCTLYMWHRVHGVKQGNTDWLPL